MPLRPVALEQQPSLASSWEPLRSKLHDDTFHILKDSESLAELPNALNFVTNGCNAAEAAASLSGVNPCMMDAHDARFEEEAEQIWQAEVASPLRTLANDIAMSVVLRELLSSEAQSALRTLLPGVVFASVALVTDSQKDDALLLENVLINGLQNTREMQETLNIASSGPYTALWRASSSCECIQWQENAENVPPPFPDWRALLAQHDDKHRKVRKIITIPLHIVGCLPIGAATFALDTTRSDCVSEAILHNFCTMVCSAICHTTKNLWEVSLGFLVQVMPSRVVRRMLTAACTAPAQLGNQASHSSHSHLAGQNTTTAEDSTLALAGEQVEGPVSTAVLAADANKNRKKEAVAVASAIRPHPATLAAQVVVATESVPRSNTSLEFADAGIESAFQSWFDTSQAAVDRRLSTARATIAALLAAAALLQGGPRSVAVFVALQIGVGGFILSWGIICCGKQWFASHRTALVISARVAGTTSLLAHWALHPDFYAGSMTKAIVGRGIARLLLSVTLAKLRFPLHFMATILELYACALVNTVAFRGQEEAPDNGPGLKTTVAAQLGAACIGIGVAYVLEKRTRRTFLARHGPVNT